MRYKRIRKVPWQGNSDRCLVLRHLYAKKALSLLESAKIILNIDESWLPETCMKRMKWQRQGDKNSVDSKLISHRISMIVALDSKGNVYLSLSQVNTDHNVMLMFLTKLSSLLTSERPEWKSDTCLLFDNATYHKHADLRSHMASMGIDVLYSAPYSFETAPVELWLANFKRGELNPDRLPVGKK